MAIRSTGQVLKRLRSLMKHPQYVSEQVQAYIIPSCDCHQSEYIAECDKRREFISGFSGSAGTAIVTHDAAALFTDGRYYLQAERQLDKAHWQLVKEGLPGSPTQAEWLKKVLPNSSRVGCDPFVMPSTSWRSLSKELEQFGHQLIPIDKNLIDAIWDDRPNPPTNPIVPLDLKFTGQTWKEKVNKLQGEMSTKGASALIVTALDEVAWLFNLRGSDIEFNPVFFSYAALTTETV